MPAAECYPGSTRLRQDYPSAMETALKRHDELLEATVHLNNGHVLLSVGDAFCCASARVDDAVEAALAVQLIEFMWVHRTE